MSVNENCCDGFCHFYRDESLVGHIFLRPSIFVADGYKWIFSDLTGDTCNSIVEVISRIILFIFLPIIALLSSVFIPIGLTCKGIASLCTPPKPKQEKVPVRVNNALKKKAHTPPKTVQQGTKNPNQPAPPVVTQEPQKQTLSTGVNPPVNNQTHVAPPLTVVQAPQKPALSPQLIQQLNVANGILNRAAKVLDAISFKKIDMEKVGEAKTLLSSLEVGQLLCEVPQKQDSTSPLCVFSDKYSFLLGQTAELERHFTYYSQPIAENGELEVDGYGDCLFDSFVTQAKMNGSMDPTQSPAVSARSGIFDKIMDHYRGNLALQQHLAHSCNELYQAEMEKLEMERQELEVVAHTPSGVDPSQLGNAMQRLSKIVQEKNNLFTEILLKKNGEALNLLLAAAFENQWKEILKWVGANYSSYPGLQLLLINIIMPHHFNMATREMEREDKKILINTLNGTEHAESKMQITNRLTAISTEMETEFKTILETTILMTLKKLVDAFDMVQYERQATVEWIQAHYESDLVLQQRLAHSLTEHYHSKMEMLESERDGLLTVALSLDTEISPTEKLHATKRLKEIFVEIETLYKILMQIGDAFGSAHSTDIHFESVKKIVPIYLNDMSKKGAYGGAAELYALSCRHEICAKVYAKVGSKIENEPSLVENLQFEKEDKPARSFTKTRNHYNPYFPT